MASHNHRAIVQRTRSIKDAHQQVVTQFRIELHAAVSHILQPDISLDNDQRPCLSRSERRRRKDDLVVHAFAKLPAMPRKRHTKSISKRNQRLANFRLEQNDDRDTDIQQPVTENELQRREISGRAIARLSV